MQWACSDLRSDDLVWKEKKWKKERRQGGGLDIACLAANRDAKISNNWKHDWFSAANASGILVSPSLSAEFVKCIILSVWKFPRHLFAGGKCEQITHDGLPNFPDGINQVYEIADSWIISEQKHWSIFNLKGNACQIISFKWFHYYNRSVGNEHAKEGVEECLLREFAFAFPTQSTC